MYDILIIGAGVIGTSIARELSKYNMKIALLEKTKDVSNGSSKANSGIVHGRYAAKHGTLKAKMCSEGREYFPKLNEQLNFGYRKTGALVLGFESEDLASVETLKENGIKNGSDPKTLKILKGKEIQNYEPLINPETKYALYDSEVGVCSPYEMTIALAENAIKNGLDLFLENEVVDILKENNKFKIKTNQKNFDSRIIINCAGVNSDKIAEMVNADNFKITPRKGQYIIFEKKSGEKINNVVFQLPTKKGKGVLVTSTYHGNLMIGPDSQEIFSRDDKGTDIESLKYIVDTAQKSVPNILEDKMIRSFSGLRATPDKDDFIIEESNVDNFINVAGIESPGLTSSPAIAKEIIKIIKTKIDLKEKKNFDPHRKPIIIKKSLSNEEVKERLFIDSSPEKIICRCEQVTEGEIVDALNRNIFITTLDGVKRRTRAGMGYCQGNFCGPRVKELITRENDIPEDKITKSSGSADNFERFKKFHELK
ncbi:MAG: NAD(P)/FAD-dependent oxidoreductase [Thermotogota bacterium]